MLDGLRAEGRARELAGLEAFAGFCAGCFAFGYLMRFGIIPAEVCQRCADLNFGPKAKSSA